MTTLEDTRYAVTRTGTPICTHPRTGVVTSHRGRGRYDGPIAVTPVCDRPECIDEALAWVARMSRKPAHHVSDGGEAGRINVAVAIVVAAVGLFLWGFAHPSRTAKVVPRLKQTSGSLAGGKGSISGSPCNYCGLLEGHTGQCPVVS